MSTKSISVDQIKSELRSRIQSGFLAEGARVPSEHELAREFRLSRNYARQALSDLQAEGLLIRRRGSGSYVAPKPESPSVIDARDNQTVALVFPQQSRFMRNVMEGFMDGLLPTGFHVITYNLSGHPNETSEAAFLRKVIASGIVGLIVWIDVDNTWTRQLIQELLARQYPFVLVDRYLPGIDTDYVVSENEEIGFLMTKTLIERGHKLIAFIGLTHSSTSSEQDRFKGYKRALQEASLPIEDNLIVYQEDLRESAETALLPLLAQYNRPTAAVCKYDLPASYFYHALIKLGYRVPDHMELAMVDDEHNQVLSSLPFIRVAQRGYDMGLASAELLIHRIEKPDSPRQHRYIEPDIKPITVMQKRQLNTA